MSNLDKLRKLKQANQQKEKEITSSFSIGEGEAEDQEKVTEIAEEQTEEKKLEHKEPESDMMQESVESSEIKEQKTTKPPKTSKQSKADRPNKPNKASKPEKKAVSAIPEQKANLEELPEPEKNLTFRFASEEDMQYLDLAPIMNETCKKAFFIELMKNAVASGPVEFTDETYLAFRSTPLVTKSVTISVPVSLITEVKKCAAKNLMKFQRYIAYVIHKARVNDENWEF